VTMDIGFLEPGLDGHVVSGEALAIFF
jgi:hypothetical protein